jgi:hypothetical protein
VRLAIPYGAKIYSPPILRRLSLAFPLEASACASTSRLNLASMLTVCPIGYGFGFGRLPVVLPYSGRLYLASLPFGLTGAYSVGVHRPFNFPMLYGHSRGRVAGYREGRYLAAYSSNPPRSSLLQRCSLPCPSPGSQPGTGTPRTRYPPCLGRLSDC